MIQERLNKLPSIQLQAGEHSPPRGEDDIDACAMELVSWVAGEPWSDAPLCACPVISTFIRSWNDALFNAERNELLLPLVPRLIGTRASKAIEARRAAMAADWFIRVNTPAWLRAAGLIKHAEALETLPEITSSSTMVPTEVLKAAQLDARAMERAAKAAASSHVATRPVQNILEITQSKVWSTLERTALCATEAVWNVSTNATAESATWSAAEAHMTWRGAAWDAVKISAVKATESAAWSAAWDTARSVAWNAAESSAKSALKPIVKQLQRSAVELIERMIAASEARQRVWWALRCNQTTK